jgi:hypothetical protein
MSVIERKTRHQRTFEWDSGGSKPYSLVATNSCGTRDEFYGDFHSFSGIMPVIMMLRNVPVGKSFPR